MLVEHEKNLLSRHQLSNPVSTVPKKDIVILLSYLGLQSNQVAKPLKSCVYKFYSSVNLKIIFQHTRCIKSFFPYKDRINRSQHHRRRRTQRTTTGSKISPYCAAAHARLVVHTKFRTSERQVCRPERTWACIYVFTLIALEAGNLFQTIYGNESCLVI